MIRVMIFDAEGSVRCGGAELVPVALDPAIAGWIDIPDQEMMGGYASWKTWMA